MQTFGIKAESNEVTLIDITSNTLTYTYTISQPFRTNMLLASADPNCIFYRRILSLIDMPVSNTVLLFTEDVTVADCIKSGSFSPSGFSDYGTNGARLAATSKLSVGGEWVFTEGGALLNIVNEPNVTVDAGDWSFEARISANGDIDLGKLESCDLVFTADLEANIIPNIIIQENVTENYPVNLWKKHYIKGTLIGVPPVLVPVWVEIVLELNAGAEISTDASATLNSGGVSLSKHFSQEIKLRNGKWNYETINPPVEIEPVPVAFTLQGGGTVTVYLQPKVTVYLVSLAGAWVDVRPNTRFDFTYSTPPENYNISLYAGVDLGIGFDSRIWFEDWWGPMPSWDIPLYEKLLWSEASQFSAPVIKSGPNNVVCRAGETARFSVDVESNPPANFQWYRNGAIIPGANNDEYSFNASQSAQGTYKLVAKNSIGQDSSSATLTVISGDVPSGMALIPAGSFQMGDTFNEGQSDELPVHNVYISAFYMDKYEVSNEKMREVMQWAYNNDKITATSSTVQNNSGNQKELLDLDDSDCQISFSSGTFYVEAGKGNYPCVEITWYGTCAYSNFRSEMEGKNPCYNFTDWSCNWSANGYRLPTEAEWEKAARGGASGHRFPWHDTDTIQHARANYYSSSNYTYDTSPTRGFHPTFNTGTFPYTSPVGYFAPNAYGLYDMAGNVWEWNNDWYSSSWYSNAGATSANTRGPASGSYRVIRGGSWSSYAYYTRCADRYDYTPSFSYNNIGFRCVCP